MEKARKLNEAIQLLEIVRHTLTEIGEACESEKKLIFKALEVEDAEQVEDASLYKIVLDLDYNAGELKSNAEDVASIVKYLEKIKL